jgi:hypothetical protein
MPIRHAALSGTPGTRITDVMNHDAPLGQNNWAILAGPTKALVFTVFPGPGGTDRQTLRTSVDLWIPLDRVWRLRSIRSTEVTSSVCRKSRFSVISQDSAILDLI